jgi:hypothetical protein
MVLLSGGLSVLRRAPCRRPFYRCVEITLEYLGQASPTATVVLSPFPGKNSKVIRDLSLCRRLLEEHIQVLSLGYALVGIQLFSMECRYQTRLFLWRVIGFSAVLSKRATRRASGESKDNFALQPRASGVHWPAARHIGALATQTLSVVLDSYHFPQLSHLPIHLKFSCEKVLLFPYVIKQFW